MWQLPDDFQAFADVFPDVFVVSYKDQVAADRLPNQHSVERVFVMFAVTFENRLACRGVNESNSNPKFVHTCGSFSVFKLPKTSFPQPILMQISQNVIELT